MAIINTETFSDFYGNAAHIGETAGGLFITWEDYDERTRRTFGTYRAAYIYLFRRGYRE